MEPSFSVTKTARDNHRIVDSSITSVSRMSLITNNAFCYFANSIILVAVELG